MTNIYSIFTKQPITQDNDIGSKYFRVTSHSKPDTVSARRKREILLSLGWEEIDTGTLVYYTHEQVLGGKRLFLHDAWDAQITSELADRYWGRLK